MIYINSISKSFKNLERKAINDVSFTANSGRIMGILGANGSGKTTLMRLISGILKPDCGTIEICNVNVLSDTQEARKHIGVLLGGEVSLYDRLTAYENMLFFAQLQGISHDKAQKRISVISKMLGMDKYLDRRVASFSRGMKQKIAFGNTIIHDPDVILLDEPSTGLDIYSVRDVENFILECKKQGKTILLSTHNAHEIETLCDDVIILKDGFIVEQDTLSNVMVKSKTENVMDMFFSLEGAVK